MTTLHMKHPVRDPKARHRTGSPIPAGAASRRITSGLAALVDAVDRLTRDASPVTGSADVLDHICALGTTLIQAGACAVYVKTPRQAGLRLGTVYPSTFPAPPTCPREAVAAWNRTPGVRSTSGPAAGSCHMPGLDEGTFLLAVPLTLAAAGDGVLLFAGHRGRRFTHDERSLAERLAQIAGVVLRNHQLRDLANGRLRPEVLMWETLDPAGPGDFPRTLAQARRLGHDLLAPHVIVVGKGNTAEAAERSHRSVLRAIPGALTDLVGATVVAIVPPDRVAAVASEGLSLGVSRCCCEMHRYAAAYREAQEAVEIGSKLFGPHRVTHIEDLDSYRFIPTFIKGGLMQHAEYQLVSRLPDDLLKTLEIYLDAGGNSTRAAKRLFLHRNTLRQRLDRISGLLEVDLTTSERWLSLQLAVKAARLARVGGAADSETGGRTILSGSISAAPVFEATEAPSPPSLLR